MSELSLSNIINVSIIPTQAGLGLPNINTAALFTRDTPESGWDVGEEFKLYTNPTEVGDDFGTDSDAYTIAVSFFAQNPNVLNTNGYLAIVLLESSPSPETVEAAIARVLDQVYFFGILVDEDIADSPLQSLADYVQTLDKLLFYASADAADFASGAILDDIRTAGDTHTRCLYYLNADSAIATQKFAAAYAGRALSTNFSGSNTTQTMHLKQLAGFVPDPSVDQTALTAAQAAGVDVYASFSGLIGLFTSGANTFFDEIYNELWFKFALQVAGANYLAQTSTKIPQTEPGMEGLKNVLRRICAQGVRNAFIAPGEWTSSTVFGDPESLRRNIQDIGYYVYSVPISQQSQAEREAREAPLVQIAIKTGGAIHKATVIVNVNL